MLPRKLDFYRKNPKDKYYFAINTWASRADIYLMGVQNAACKVNYKTYQDYVDAGGTPL